MFQDYYILDEEVYTEDVVFAVRKEDAVLGKIIDKAVYKLRTQDVLDRVQRKWFLTGRCVAAAVHLCLAGGAFIRNCRIFCFFVLVYS